MTRTRLLFAAALLCGCASLLNGCKPDAAVQKAEVIGTGNKTEVQPPDPSSAEPASGDLATPIGNSVISGTVSFSGKAPEKIKIDTSMDPACEMGGSSGPVYTEQYAGNGGKLANVFLYVKSGPPAAMQMGEMQTQPVVLDQKGCQYLPHVIGVQQGGYVQFRNSDVTMHNIHTMPAVVGNQTIDISEGPRGAAVTKQFQKPELMIPVRCNNHPWMNAFINVSSTPFFAVSDAGGHFTITGLPAGNYVIGAVHEKLGEQDVNVSVPSAGKAKADFMFSAK